MAVTANRIIDIRHPRSEYPDMGWAETNLPAFVPGTETGALWNDSEKSKTWSRRGLSAYRLHWNLAGAAGPSQQITYDPTLGFAGLSLYGDRTRRRPIDYRWLVRQPMGAAGPSQALPAPPTRPLATDSFRPLSQRRPPIYWLNLGRMNAAFAFGTAPLYPAFDFQRLPQGPTRRRDTRPRVTEHHYWRQQAVVPFNPATVAPSILHGFRAAQRDVAPRRGEHVFGKEVPFDLRLAISASQALRESYRARARGGRPAGEVGHWPAFCFGWNSQVGSWDEISLTYPTWDDFCSPPINLRYVAPSWALWSTFRSALRDLSPRHGEHAHGWWGGIPTLNPTVTVASVDALLASYMAWARRTKPVLGQHAWMPHEPTFPLYLGPILSQLDSFRSRAADRRPRRGEAQPEWLRATIETAFDAVIAQGIAAVRATARDNARRRGEHAHGWWEAVATGDPLRRVSVESLLRSFRAPAPDRSPRRGDAWWTRTIGEELFAGVAAAALMPPYRMGPYDRAPRGEQGWWRAFAVVPPANPADYLAQTRQLTLSELVRARSNAPLGERGWWPPFNMFTPPDVDLRVAQLLQLLGSFRPPAEDRAPRLGAHEDWWLRTAVTTPFDSTLGVAAAVALLAPYMTQERGGRPAGDVAWWLDFADLPLTDPTTYIAQTVALLASFRSLIEDRTPRRGDVDLSGATRLGSIFDPTNWIGVDQLLRSFRAGATDRSLRPGDDQIGWLGQFIDDLLADTAILMAPNALLQTQRTDARRIWLPTDTLPAVGMLEGLVESLGPFAPQWLKSFRLPDRDLAPRFADEIGWWQAGVPLIAFNVEFWAALESLSRVFRSLARGGRPLGELERSLLLIAAAPPSVIRGWEIDALRVAARSRQLFENPAPRPDLLTPALPPSIACYAVETDVTVPDCDAIETTATNADCTGPDTTVTDPDCPGTPPVGIL